MISAVKQAFGGMARQCWPYGIFREDKPLSTGAIYVWIVAVSLTRTAAVIDTLRAIR
jgi:hypothetical protein